MKGTTYLFLDFDGVICDSVAECYVSSWIGYYHRSGRRPEAVSIADKERFYKIRPYIRDAEDYLVLHYAVEHDIPLDTQSGFDELSKSIGKETLRQYHEQFFVGRTELCNFDRDYWLSLHPMYEHIEPMLPKFAENNRVHILSTKASRFVSIILREQGYPWPEERIHYSKGREKIPLISAFLDKEAGAAAYFIEDQIDNVLHNDDPRITPRLASWGYIREEWRRQTKVPLLPAEEFNELAGRILKGP